MRKLEFPPKPEEDWRILRNPFRVPSHLSFWKDNRSLKYTFENFTSTAKESFPFWLALAVIAEFSVIKFRLLKAKSLVLVAVKVGLPYCLSMVQRLLLKKRATSWISKIAWAESLMVNAVLIILMFFASLATPNSMRPYNLSETWALIHSTSYNLALGVAISSIRILEW